MISVSQNRFQAPQRIARNNQTPNHNRTAQAQPAFKSNASLSLGIVVGFLGGLFGGGLVEGHFGHESAKRDIAPIIDSLSNHKLNAKNIDGFITAREIAQQADSLSKVH